MPPLEYSTALGVTPTPVKSRDRQEPGFVGHLMPTRLDSEPGLWDEVKRQLLYSML